MLLVTFMPMVIKIEEMVLIETMNLLAALKT